MKQGREVQAGRCPQRASEEGNRSYTEFQKREGKRRKALGRRVGDVGKPMERGTRRSSSLFS